MLFLFIFSDSCNKKMLLLESLNIPLKLLNEQHCMCTVKPLHDADGKVALSINVQTHRSIQVSINFLGPAELRIEPGTHWLKDECTNELANEDFPVNALLFCDTGLLPLRTHPMS